MSSTVIAAYMALFFGAGFLFVFVNLLIGRFLRPSDPHPEKLEIYECGEPTIGSSFVQFDLRFYVVALLFLIFDVEVAFFFPWATVFGKANHLRDPHLVKVADGKLTEPARGLYRELGVPAQALPGVASTEQIEADATALAWFSFWDILVFFGVVLVGFAYVWYRGDLDWVRAVSRERGEPAARAPPPTREPRQPALV
jgi:NADH-quinone oxidoreductase subunit A